MENGGGDDLASGMEILELTQNKDTEAPDKKWLGGLPIILSNSKHMVLYIVWVSSEAVPLAILAILDVLGSLAAKNNVSGLRLRCAAPAVQI